MDLIPDEELRGRSFLNLTPMVDFLFLVVAIFAILTITRADLFDSEISLAKIELEQSPSKKQNTSAVNLSVTKSGQYKWITELSEYSMEGIPTILQELSRQKQLGLLPSESENVKILIHIDEKAEWDSIVQLIYSLKKNGYSPHPIHEKKVI